MKPGLIIVQLKVFSNICQSAILCESIFQRPKDSFNEDDETWYEKRSLGKNKLGNMMSELSRAAALSKNYTNHCITATAISALDRSGYEARHIMTVSGHRNEAYIKS